MKKLKQLGKNSLKCEVTNVSPFGVWVLFNNHEYFLDHKRFPWFRKSSIEAIANVKALSANHLYWPQLDIDLHLDSIRNADKYPLVSKIAHNNQLNLTPRKRRKSA